MRVGAGFLSGRLSLPIHSTTFLRLHVGPHGEVILHRYRPTVIYYRLTKPHSGNGAPGRFTKFPKSVYGTGRDATPLERIAGSIAHLSSSPPPQETVCRSWARLAPLPGVPFSVCEGYSIVTVQPPTAIPCFRMKIPSARSPPLQSHPLALLPIRVPRLYHPHWTSVSKTSILGVGERESRIPFRYALTITLG